MSAEVQSAGLRARVVRRARALRAFLGASLRAAFEPDVAIEPGIARAIGALGLLGATGLFALAWQRHATFHARNFDLAFYARLAWGEAHGSSWEPLLDAHVWGLHFVWVLEVLGPVGLVLGQVRALLLVQSVAVAAAAWPLARLAAREMREPGAPRALARAAPLLVAIAWLLQPNLWHVATCDFHPGTLAVLPLAWCCDALHRRSAHGLVWSALGVLACREDLGLCVGLFGLALALRSRAEGARSERVTGWAVAGLSLAYVGTFLGVFHPRFAPRNGSFAQHFGVWGGGPLDVVGTLLTDPARVLAWLAEPSRASYLLVLAAPAALLSFLAPEWLLLAGPVLAMNVLSAFPTTLFLDSHYLTPALPIVLAAAVIGAARLPALLGRVSAPMPRAGGLVPLAVGAATLHLVAGGSPLGARFDRGAYVDDAVAASLREAVSHVGPTASVQAPERALAHLAERRVLRFPPPPEANTDFVIFDAWHRRRDAHREELLRTDEEPIVRDWLAREDHTLVFARDAVYVLERGSHPERDVSRRHVVGRAQEGEGRALTACLALVDATVTPEGEQGVLALTLAARGPCEPDLALRIGWGHRPRRVDLIADGELSPARFRAGDRIVSRHVLSGPELRDVRAHGLRVGAIRASGARPDHGDPVALDVVL